jgi:hypothetical protein
MATFNIQEALLGALQGSGNSQNAAGAESDILNGILQKMGILTQSSTGAIDAKTSATIAVEDQALQGVQGAQDATIKFAKAAGTDIQSPEQILVDLGTQLRQQVQAAQTAQARIQNKESLRIIDNPLAWLQGQLTVEQDYKEYNRAADNANLASKSIAELTAATDKVAQTQQNLARKVTDASRAAAAEARIAQGQLERDAINKNHLQSEMAVAQAITQNTAAQAAETQRQFNLLVTADGLELERERFDWSKEKFNWEKEAQAANKKDKKSSDEVKAMLLQQYNIGARVLGMPEETNWDYVAGRAQLGGTDASRISAAMESGGNTMSAGSERVASTPAGAAAMLTRRVYPKADDPGFAPIKKYLKDTLDAVAQLGGKEDQVLANMNAKVAADAKNYTDNALATGSFYAPPDLDVIYQAESVRATPLYKKVLSTAGKDLKSADPSAIASLAFAAADKGLISYEEAASGITELYSQAVNINNATKKFAQVGIPSQESFNVKPDIAGPDNVKVNLADYSSTLRFLAVMKARDSFGVLLYAPHVKKFLPSTDLTKPVE